MEFASPSSATFPYPNRTLVVMAKAPKAGMVKTRLTASLPTSAVTALYQCLLKDTLALAKSLADVHVAVMCPESDHDELTRFLSDPVEVVAQQGTGLAAGLTSVFRHFTAGERKVIAFNSDSPHLPPSILEAAFEMLAAHDVVVGPTRDGGYYLVGAKAAHPSLFENDGLGTKNALERLLERTRTLQLSTSFTAPFYDIDLAGDLLRLGEELRITPAKAPLSAAWFADWKEVIAPLRSRSGNL